tara:strand:- start:144 stop:389 length:246 start_codon:yes stop_codon:yes gene_type:complete
MRIFGIMFTIFLGTSLCLLVPSLEIDSIWLGTLLMYLVFLAGSASGMLLFLDKANDADFYYKEYLRAKGVDVAEVFGGENK